MATQHNSYVKTSISDGYVKTLQSNGDEVAEYFARQLIVFTETKSHSMEMFPNGTFRYGEYYSLPNEVVRATQPNG